MIELFRSAGFRVALTLSISFITLSLGLFGFIYWQTTEYQVRRTDAFLVNEENQLATNTLADMIAAVG
jgi:hypothetical protein